MKRDGAGQWVDLPLAAKKGGGKGKASPGGGGAKRGARKKKSPAGSPSTPSGGPPSGPPAPPAGPPALPGGGGYQRTSDIGVAETFARTLGVGFVRFHDPNPAWNNAPVIEEIANNTNEALDGLQVRGILDVPRRIETERKFFEEAGRQLTAWAVYIHNPMSLTGLQSNWMHLNRALLLNPRPEWVNVGQVVTAMHQAGYLSTADLHHFVYHEMGHFLLDQDRPHRNRAADDQVLLAALPAIRPYISDRAALASAEFVAEVFSQLVVGVQPVSSQVLMLYQQFGGRTI
jgi:hypothetical protein